LQNSALEHARARLGEQPPTPAQLASDASPPGQKIERIVVKDGPKVHIIPVDKLNYIEAQDDYIALHSGGKNYLRKQTISNIEAQLHPVRFARIHRSHIVNLERIVRIEPYTEDSRVVILQDGARIPASRSGLANLKFFLGEEI
jgi:two-component system LytT family response regulator